MSNREDPKIAVAAPVEPTWVTEVIHYWFEELKPADWFAKNAQIDAQIRGRFSALREQLVANGGLGIATPRSILAAVLVLDQFSRNLFRDDPRAYAADAIARRLSRTAIESGDDVAMEKEERYFLYIPFEHSENRDDQALAVSLIRQLGNAEWTRYATEHQAIIDRFARFPRRNAALNRSTTAQERAYMDEGQGSF
jgi:uncharacterized protein (DUF924 family)